MTTTLQDNIDHATKVYQHDLLRNAMRDGRTQETFANIIGRDQSTISRWYNGSLIMSVRDLIMVAAFTQGAPLLLAEALDGLHIRISHDEPHHTPATPEKAPR